MLNIISKSVKNKKTRGPKKVVENLILGLEKMGYPFVLNKDLNSCKRLWIHDDIGALGELKNIDSNVKVIVGPNLFVNPENIPDSIDLSKTIYIHPSINVKNIWEKRGYTQSPIEVWPVGIDTETYIPFTGTKDTVLIYFKNRGEKELAQLERILREKNIPYAVVKYGSYTENEYLNVLKKTQYIIWLGIYESQGIALEEALSCNIPILVLDTQKPTNDFDKKSTSAPYFDITCGIIVKDAGGISSAIDTMQNGYKNFQPRTYILNNLEVKKQAEKFLSLFEKYFHLKVVDGFNEKCENCKEYKVGLLKKLHNAYIRIIHYLCY